MSSGNFQCLCTNGFSGIRCDVSKWNGNVCTNRKSKPTFFFLVSSCLSNPCNQGACVTSSSCVGSICGYSCLCPNGTSGKGTIRRFSSKRCCLPLGTNCEIGGNACWNTPCRNGGTCLPLSSSYLCQCPASFGGTNCELPINICTPNPCLNSGVCIPSTTTPPGSYRCECAASFIGARCEFRK